MTTVYSVLVLSTVVVLVGRSVVMPNPITEISDSCRAPKGLANARAVRRHNKRQTCIVGNASPSGR